MAKQELKLKLDPTAVSMRLVDDQVGGLRETTEYWCRRLDCQVVKTWSGERALTPADAARLVDAWRTATAEHSAKWDRYRSWQQAEKERKAKERAERFAAERAEAQRIRDIKRQQWILEEIQGREAALAEAEEAQGTTFAEWERENVSLLTDTPS